MILPFLIRPEAEQDLKDIYRWYEDQIEGLGREFLLCVDAALERMKRNPHAFAVVYHAVRRVLIRRFPYGILYRVEDNRIVVLAVFHARRSPKTWAKRVLK